MILSLDDFIRELEELGFKQVPKKHRSDDTNQYEFFWFPTAMVSDMTYDKLGDDDTGYIVYVDISRESKETYFRFKDPLDASKTINGEGRTVAIFHRIPDGSFENEFEQDIPSDDRHSDYDKNMYKGLLQEIRKFVRKDEERFNESTT